MFWADVDTNPDDGGFVWYRIADSPDLKERALKDIQRAYSSVPDVDYLLIATWDHVGYFPEQTDKVKYHKIHCMAHASPFTILLFSVHNYIWIIM